MQYNDPMAQPPPDAIPGLDLIIWIDEDGDPTLTAYSSLGKDYILSVNPFWDGEAQLSLSDNDPVIFLQSLPKSLVVGVQNPETKEVHLTNKKCLH